MIRLSRKQSSTPLHVCCMGCGVAKHADEPRCKLPGMPSHGSCNATVSCAADLHASMEPAPSQAGMPVSSVHVWLMCLCGKHKECARCKVLHGAGRHASKLLPQELALHA